MKRLCEVLNVSRSGYYAWKKRSQSLRAQENLYLLDQIKKVYLENRRVYGSPRIHMELINNGISCGVHRIAKLMRANGIQAEQHRRIKRKAVYTSTARVPNLVNREFTVAQPNKLWATDMTCFWTGSGWLNLAIVMDLHSRKIVGWAMKSRMSEELTIAALEMALLNRTPKKGLIIHSDQGTQYQSQAYQERLCQNRLLASMSRKGDCYDNAVVESFFKTLKSELLLDNRFKSREEGSAVIFEYIEIFYNKKRLHSTLGYVSPEQFEMKELTKTGVH